MVRAELVAVSVVLPLVPVEVVTGPNVHKSALAP
jgi:hypothetical protein